MRHFVIAPGVALAGLLAAGLLSQTALAQSMGGGCMQRGNMLSPANSGYGMPTNPMLSGNYYSPYNQPMMQQNYRQQQMQRAYYQQQLQQAYQQGQADLAEQKAEQAAADRKREYWKQRRADKVARRGTVKAKSPATAQSTAEKSSPARSFTSTADDLAANRSAARK